tara:strand:+ start:582 stop:812 length:231 start_codon:yes stop_codon:yes gene_type:complete
MTKRLIINKENPNGVLVDMTAEEIADIETKTQESVGKIERAKINRQAKIDLKASAKAKLVAGEALTEEEANVLVGV